MFPSTEVSAFNSVAPVVTEDVMLAFKADKNMQMELLLNLRRICEFWDFSLTEEPEVVFSLKPEFSTKPDVEVIFRNTSKFHNFLRLTRVIKSLYALGLEPYAYALKKFAMEVLKDNIKVPPTTVKFWKDSIPDPSPSSETVEYAAPPPPALVASTSGSSLDDTRTSASRQSFEDHDLVQAASRAAEVAVERPEKDIDYKMQQQQQNQLRQLEPRRSASQESKYGNEELTPINLADEDDTKMIVDPPSVVGKEHQDRSYEYTVGSFAHDPAANSFSGPRSSHPSPHPLSTGVSAARPISTDSSHHGDITDICQFCDTCMKSVM